MLEAALTAGFVLVFLAGFYTGLWVQRHSYVDREVPKIITTEKLVEVEKPVVIQVPTPARSNGGGNLAIMGGNGPKSSVIDPGKRAEADRQFDLLNQMPEV
jgi:hypothetical protein